MRLKILKTGVYTIGKIASTLFVNIFSEFQSCSRIAWPPYSYSDRTHGSFTSYICF